MYRNRALISHLCLAVTVPVWAQVKMHLEKEIQINLVVVAVVSEAVDKVRVDLEDF